jgi:hypothetical protein
MAQLRIIHIGFVRRVRRREIRSFQNKNSGRGLVGGGIGDVVDDKDFDGASS